MLRKLIINEFDDGALHDAIIMADAQAAERRNCWSRAKQWNFSAKR